jgi:hypothetical protein
MLQKSCRSQALDGWEVLFLSQDRSLKPTELNSVAPSHTFSVVYFRHNFIMNVTEFHSLLIISRH